MKRIAFALLLLVAGAAMAQTPPTPVFSGKALGWDQTAASLDEVISFTYRYYLDGSATGQVLPNITCTGTTVTFACSSPFPAVTPGPHTIKLTAGNQAGESAPTGALSFTFMLVPSTPTGLRIQ